MYRPGSWCDVCVLPDGRIAFVRVEGTNVVCEIDGAEAWRVDAKVESLFLRCAALADGTVAAIVKANDPKGSALLILRNTVMNLGPTAGNNPVALTATHAYIVTAPDLAHRVRLDDGFEEAVALSWTSQGIRDVVGDQVITADTTYAASVKGYNFGEFQTRGDLTVGQHGFGIGVLIGSQFFIARQGPTNYGVHGAQSGSRIAVCAYTEAGSYFQDFTPPYPAGPVVTPPPVPVPPLPENPMALMAPNEIEAVRRAMREHPEIDTKNDATRGRVLDYACSYLGGRPWGRKKKGDGSLNTDAMAYLRPDGDVEYYDAIDGNSGAASWGGGPGAGPFKPGQNGNWTEALPVNESGGGTPTPPPNVHMYDGGEHDTDECDICHLSRFDPVHLIPESTVKHVYNGGEQDTGLCDICQKPVGDPIHNTAPEPQPPPGGTTSPGGTVSFDDDATRLLTQILDSCHAQETRQAEIVGAVQELREAVVGAGKNLTAEILKAAPAFLAALLPLLKKSSAAARAAKVTRKSRK